jgi:hypothetical protein
LTSFEHRAGRGRGRDYSPQKSRFPFNQRAERQFRRVARGQLVKSRPHPSPIKLDQHHQQNPPSSFGCDPSDANAQLTRLGSTCRPGVSCAARRPCRRRWRSTASSAWSPARLNTAMRTRW